MPNRKLTPQQIEEIRAMKKQIESEGETFNYSQVARQYGVSGQTIRRNIEPNENDKKPRSYNPDAATNYQKNNSHNYRRYLIKLNKKNEEENLIIEKLDSLPNKNRYIKNLILEDISSDEE